ncbi:MAG: hypothetical protein ACKOKG_10090, partial [Verrucomicrobiota bacterium]
SWNELRIGPQLHPGEDGPFADMQSALENFLGMAVEPHVGAEKSAARLSYSVLRLHPAADKIARFCGCFR